MADQEGESHVVMEERQIEDHTDGEGPRKRTPTEKGIQWQLLQLKGKFRSSVTKWQRQASSVTVLLSDSDSCTVIIEKQKLLDEHFDEVCMIFDEICLLDQDSPLSDKFDSVAEEHRNLMLHISDFVRSLDLEKRSTHSSNRSSLSRASHATKVSVAAEAASLKAQLKYVDAEAKTRGELEKIDIMKRLDMATARLEAFKSVGQSSRSVSEAGDLPTTIDKKAFVQRYIESQANSQIEPQEEFHIESKRRQYTDHADFTPVVPDIKPKLEVTGPDLNINVPEFVPKQSNEQALKGESTEFLQQGLLKLTKSLADQVTLNRLPPPEPSVFYGDPIKYPAWKAAFKTLIEGKKLPEGEKIHYLKKYLGGSVLQVVDNYFLLSSDNAFEEAKGLLDERYGDPFVLASAFRDKLELWPKMNSRDARGLLRFSDFLRQCLTASSSISNLQILNDSRENRKILTKLPEWIVARWNRIVCSHKDGSGDFPSFEVFVEFIRKEAKLANDPVTSIQSLKGIASDETKGDKSYQKQSPKPGYQPAGSRSFLTNQGPQSSSNLVGSNISCAFCKGPHQLEYCHAFLGKQLVERKAFIREKRLCFACLGDDHISKHCKKRKQCKTCQRLHPSCLHGDKFQGNTSVQDERVHSKPEKGTSLSSVSFMSRVGSYQMSSMILPVYVSVDARPGVERLVYALLDTQSDTTFILESTCQSLGVSGVDVNLMLSTMHAENKVVKSQKVRGLSVRGFNDSQRLSLPDTYTRQIMPADKSHIPTPEMARKLPYLAHISNKLLPLQDCEVGLLIGYNCAQALMPREVIAPDTNGPYAQRTDLGWGIVGVVAGEASNGPVLDDVGVSHRILVCEVEKSLAPDNKAHDRDKCLVSVRNRVKEIINPTDIVRMMNIDFVEREEDKLSLSVEDQQFIDIMKDGIKKVNVHYQMPLPLKKGDLKLPNNKQMAFQRLNHLRRRLQRDKQFQDHYCSFMENAIKNGYAERVHESDLDRDDGKVWYIPHHGVYHPKKPDKIRVVFDCSATYMGDSLNNHLLQGPDLTNTLVGVLCRFRKEYVAVMCDIEQMFFQFQVDPDQRDLLRFLWWENRNFGVEPVEYKMCVHLFGAVSSPGCANFGLKQIATDYESELGSDVSNFVRKNFYVDDGLTSLPTDQEAVHLIERSREMCSKGGVRLHKFLSSSKEVLQHIPPDDRAKGFENIDLLNDTLPVERALGVQWCIESDCFQFRITLSDKPLTRRGILSTVTSIYDPLGFISPVVLVGKQILQQLCADQTDWDSPISDLLKAKWECWRNDLHNLDSLRIRRCLKPDGFGQVVSTELHHFSDASNKGYGQCSYIRLVDDKQHIHCSLVMSKARVVPLKPVTVPRLELTAAVVSVKIGAVLERELELKDATHWYWTDSKVVLGYLANDSRRFHVYVANRVQQIHDKTDKTQWKHVSTKENPADIASRGISAKELVKESRWLDGPEFLWKESLPSSRDETPVLCPDDPEIKKSQAFNTRSEEIAHASMCEQFEYFSGWIRLKKVVALCLRFIRILKKRVSGEISSVKNTVCLKSPKRDLIMVSVEELVEAERRIFRVVQGEAFSEEIRLLRKVHTDKSYEGSQSVEGQRSLLKGHSTIFRIDPFLDSEDVLRVGGRLKRSQMDIDVKHPVILPKKSHVTELVVRHFHERVCHQGRGITSNEIRLNGIWVVGLNSVVSRLIWHCVTCRRLRGVTQVQKMADLPEDRIEPAPPFTFSGVDYFGPWYIKEGRKEMKRYGVIFTCLCCRAVHLETAISLTTDSFINALRRFLTTRGPVRELRSDRGTNFVGAERELADAVSEMNDDQIQQFLLSKGCDFLIFKKNVPNASHMGGIWERQIRTVRNVLSCLLHQHGSQVNDEELRTFLCEVAAIVNSRPLTVQNVNDPLSADPLTPNHLLTMKSKVILSPPGQFQRVDLYSQRRWRRIQYLANQFWSRWRKEYLQTLQVRSKWVRPRRNSSVGDVVLILDNNLPRNEWSVGRIVEANPDQDGLVRKVKVVVGMPQLDDKGKRHETLHYLERPVHKLILLCETE